MKEKARTDIERLERQIKYRLSGRIRELRLLVQDNGLILQGHASTYHAKQLAQNTVMRETELPILANEIEVP